MNLQVSLAATLLFVLSANVHADDDASADSVIKLAEGQITMTAPEGWVTQTPKFRGIVDYEFEVPASEDEGSAGRVTIGGAGGGVEANFARWKGQFAGSSSVEDEIEVAGQTVHVLDIKGTYKGSPFLNEPQQPNTRMLAAIIETDKLGAYYVKFYGSRRTVGANETAFKSVINSLKVDPQE